MKHKRNENNKTKQKPHKNTGTYQTKTQDHELTCQLDNALIKHHVYKNKCKNLIQTRH